MAIGGISVVVMFLENIEKTERVLMAMACDRNG
jgi:hypothetical protein